MSRRILVACAALVLAVTAGGIALVVMARADAAPDGPPSIRGTITTVSPLGGAGVIVVEEGPQDPPGLGKAGITVNGATRIYRGRFSASTKGFLSDLRNGQ